MSENKLRQSLEEQILSTPKHHILLEAGTGVGKSKLAILKMAQLFNPSSRFLIVIPRKVLIKNWQAEFIKWHHAEMLFHITFVTYVSFPKMVGSWSLICFDEAHHLSARCREAFPYFHFSYGLYLSATLKREVTDFLYSSFHASQIERIKVSTRRAIEAEVLPDPQILLLPLHLDGEHQNLTYVKKKPHRGEKALLIPYEQKWQYRSYKGALSYRCTEQQYYNEMSGLIEWYKGKSTHPTMRNMWLHKCGERLQWLSLHKLPLTLKIIPLLHSRFLVFCNTIEESKAFSIPAVNSKVGSENLQRFNAGEINSLVAVNMLNEGINVSDCKIGLFNAINASETYQIQKIGRILRHSSPIIIIPYFKDTREEEIVQKWMQGYNPALIHHITWQQLKHFPL